MRDECPKPLGRHLVVSSGVRDIPREHPQKGARLVSRKRLIVWKPVPDRFWKRHRRRLRQIRQWRSIIHEWYVPSPLVLGCRPNHCRYNLSVLREYESFLGSWADDSPARCEQRKEPDGAIQICVDWPAAQQALRPLWLALFALRSASAALPGLGRASCPSSGLRSVA